MKFLEEFCNNYYKTFINERKCILCNQSVSNFHAYLTCCFYDNILCVVYNDEIDIIIKSENEIIRLFFDSFDFVINNIEIEFLYEEEFDNIFKLKNHCLDLYWKYKENLIFI
jgi:hypothetical protein